MATKYWLACRVEKIRWRWLNFLGRGARIFKPRFSVIAVHVVMKNIPYQSDLEYLKTMQPPMMFR